MTIMWSSAVAVVALGVASVSAQFDGPVLYGGQCPYDGLQHCLYQGAWGCIQLAGPNCVDQTQVCDAACGFSGYAYQKDQSPDRRCVCSYEDASQANGFFREKRAEVFQA